MGARTGALGGGVLCHRGAAWLLPAAQAAQRIRSPLVAGDAAATGECRYAIGCGLELFSGSGVPIGIDKRSLETLYEHAKRSDFGQRIPDIAIDPCTFSCPGGIRFCVLTHESVFECFHLQDRIVSHLLGNDVGRGSTFIDPVILVDESFARRVPMAALHRKGGSDGSLVQEFSAKQLRW